MPLHSTVAYISMQYHHIYGSLSFNVISHFTAGILSHTKLLGRKGPSQQLAPSPAAADFKFTTAAAASADACFAMAVQGAARPLPPQQATATARGSAPGRPSSPAALPLQASSWSRLLRRNRWRRWRWRRQPTSASESQPPTQRPSPMEAAAAATSQDPAGVFTVAARAD